MLDAHTTLPWNISPLEALKRWPVDTPVALLHSGRLNKKWSRYSILTMPNGAYRFCMTGKNSGKSEWISNKDNLPSINHHQFTNNPLEDLNKLISKNKTTLWIGYIGYDIARYIEKLPYDIKEDRDFPLLQFQRCPGWLVYDSVTKKWSAGGAWPDNTMPDLPALLPSNLSFKADKPKPQRTKKEHINAIQRAKNYITAGDIFQVNLTQRFTSNFSGDSRALFLSLAKTSPAWYGGYIELFKKDNEKRKAISSTSPELFLSFDSQGNITTRPIKGTSPSTTSAKILKQSEKDAAELNMIVDLLRNDLGKISEIGSVKVTQPRTIETHPTVHHGVATVTAKLLDSANIKNLISATMPGGSITGAPKIRAMEIIEQLESVRRGPYCGAMGYFYNDSGQLNILIRTLFSQLPCTKTMDNNGYVDFSVGGGIVADSTLEGEYQETLDKAAAMIAALKNQ